MFPVGNTFCQECVCEYVGKALVIGSLVGISIIFLIVFVMNTYILEFENKYGRINMTPEISPCEILTDQMIMARNNVKQYVMNPNQFSSEESEKIRTEFQNELNRITKEFTKLECDKNMDEWITPEITQKIIDQTAG